MPAITVSLGMRDESEFLFEKAEELRAIAGSAPDIAPDLRRLAENPEERASRISQRRSVEH
jgi:hypothetical protein